MRAPQGAEWLILLLLVLLLFGAKRLPEVARGLGRSMRILKTETKGLRDDDADAPAPPAQAQQALPPTTPTPPAAQPASAEHPARPSTD